MFSCRACVSRSIRAITGESQYSHQLLAGKPLIFTPHIKRIRRNASTSVAAPESEEQLVQGRQPVEAVEAEKDSDGKGPQKSISGATERQLKLELKFLQDKVKLAEHVHYTLRCDKPEKALEMCRMASKQQDAVVSWNHCVDWHMQRGKVDEALKIYNEMKKRAQFPDAYTYTIVLRGLAKSHTPGEPVKAGNLTKALSVYYSMSSPTSRVQPSIIHTNNVLKVCREALDMDAMWGVVARMPENGAGAPDEYTYAIMLDAIRHGTFGKDAQNTPLDALDTLRDKAVHEGRAVWRDVIHKWRAGQIHIDERLVIAMGEVLKMSGRIQDWDDILNLVHQTMNIPRQLPALGSPDRQIEHVPQGHGYRTPLPEMEDEEGYSDTPTSRAFMPVKSNAGNAAHPERPLALGFVEPTKAALSLLVDACTLLRAPTAAREYWALLTSTDGPYAVHPERGTYHTYLRLHSKNRASGQAVKLLQQMAAAKVAPNYATFRIAIGVCERDVKNKHNLDNARAMIDVMESTLADPDVPTLVKYLNLVLVSNDGPKIVFTLNRLDTIIHNLRSRVTYGTDRQGIPPAQHFLEIEDTFTFFRTLVGVIDTITRRGLVPEDQVTHWIGRRRQLDSFVSTSKTKLAARKMRWEAKTGQKLPDPKDMEPRKGLSMDTHEYGLRSFRWQQKVEKEEREEQFQRARAKTMATWDVRDARSDIPERGALIRAWEKKQGWNLESQGDDRWQTQKMPQTKQQRMDSWAKPEGYKVVGEVAPDSPMVRAREKKLLGRNMGVAGPVGKRKEVQEGVETNHEGWKIDSLVEQERGFADSPMDLGRDETACKSMAENDMILMDY